MRERNALFIGIFFLAAIGVAVAAIIMVSGRFLFDERLPFVSYFDGSLQGLRVGARVAFRGVQVGEVTAIKLVPKDGFNDWDIAVNYLVDPQALGISSGSRSTQTLGGLIERGLGVRLEMESFVTGLLYLNCDFFPDAPKHVSGISSSIKEIPSVPSRLQEVGKQLEQLPVMETIGDVRAFFNAGAELLRSDDVKKLLLGTHDTLRDVGQFVQESRTTMDLIRQRLDSLGRIGESSLTQLQGDLQQLSVVLKKGSNALDQVDVLLDGASPMRLRIEDLLKEWTKTGEAIRRLSEEISTRPESLIRGKR